tara:strand:+ start:29 stop:565 length:537 start_codon:yes stop_codon:yes gene_type:complete
MKLIRTDFKDLILIKHNIYPDYRGYFKEKLKIRDLESAINEKINFCQENTVKSKLNVLRGLHFQKDPFAQSKLISISSGKILDIAVDIRKESTTYGMYFSHILSCKNHESLYIPKGFAHGYLTLSDCALVNYQVDNYYKPKMEGVIAYNDDFINIDWGLDENKMIISDKDRSQNNFTW